MIYKDLPSFGYLCSLFNYDEKSGKLTWKRKTSKFANNIQIGSEVGWDSSFGRLQVTIDGENYYVSRIIWKMMTGSIPNDKQVDHDDRIRSNNAWDNLFLKTQSENLKNQSIPKNNKSGIIGVFFHKQSKSWEGQISNNKKTEAKRFKTKNEAINWRKEKEVLYGYHKNHGKNLTF